MLDPRRLQLLVALRSLGTVHAVAREMSMSPSAVSQGLATLQREAGTTLLERRGRSVTMTPAGHLLAARSIEILDRLVSTEDALRSWTGSATGIVRVGAFASALGAFVIHAARAVERAHPDLRVHLIELVPDDVWPSLTRGAVDLAIVAGYGYGAEPVLSDVDRKVIAHDELLVLSPEQQLESSTAVALSNLSGERWFVDGTDVERNVIARCRHAGFEPTIVGRVSSHTPLMLAVAAGLGVTILPQLALEPVAGVRLRRLDPPVFRTLEALTRAGATDRQSIAAVREAIIQEAARLGDLGAARGVGSAQRP